MPRTEVSLPPDVDGKLRELSQLTGLTPRDTARLLLTLLLGRARQSERFVDSFSLVDLRSTGSLAVGLMLCAMAAELRARATEDVR